RIDCREPAAAGLAGRRSRLAAAPWRRHRAGLYAVQAALDEGAASPAVRAHRAYPAAPRLPQLLADRALLQRIWRCFGHGLFRCAQSALGPGAVASYRPERTPGSGTARADRSPPACRLFAPRAGPA